MISRKVEVSELFKKHSREMRFINRLEGEVEFYFWQSAEGYEMQVCQPGMMPSNFVFRSFQELKGMLREFEKNNKAYLRMMRGLKCKNALRRLFRLLTTEYRTGFPPERS